MDQIANFKENTVHNFCHLEPYSELDVRRHEEKDVSKVLVCHDMANGYHDDSFINGTSNYDAYNFYNWGGIDIFCYFSHHFITIPPLAWINVGHTHGVKIIGTIITEWKEGAAIWNRILNSEREWKRFANTLAAIAKCMHFDGWLLNVENKISKPRVLLEFVRYLHGVLHDEVPGSLLIWYDSVTVDGYLAWQNQLNKHNKAFFDACDGIFTNYAWQERDIVKSVANADGRVHDVYIGLDVWGRKFIGGGKFNTAYAAALAHKHDCSIAIFGQAWTHEAIPSASRASLTSQEPHDANNLSRFDNYLLRDRALWATLWPYMKTRLPTQLPFMTSFCRGQGIKKWMYGEVMSEDAWFNLAMMKYQLNTAHGAHGYRLRNIQETSTTKQYALYHVPGERPCSQLHMADAFTGGSCIQINPSDKTANTKQNEHRTIKLFHCDFYIEDGIIVCVVTKKLAENREQSLNVILRIEDARGVREECQLLGRESDVSGGGREVRVVDDAERRRIQRYLLSEEPDFYVSNATTSGWDVCYYMLSSPRSRILSIDCRPSSQCGGILLGHIGICAQRMVGEAANDTAM